MKTTAGNIWYEHVGARYRIGFTREALEQKLVECFHVLPADQYAVKTKGPLLVLETNDGLEAVHSPVAGRVLFFNDKARNFPDKLTEEDVVIEIEAPKPVEVKKEPAKKSRTTKSGDGKYQQALPDRPIQWIIADDAEDDDWL